MNSPTVQWIRQNPTFNTTDVNLYPSIGVDGTGHSYTAFYTAGNTLGNSQLGYYDIVVAKLDTNGNTVWVQQNPTFNTTYYDLMPNIVVDSLGNSYVTYYTTFGRTSGQSNTGYDDIVVFKLDGNGNTLWVRQNSTFNTDLNENNSSIALDGSGNLYICYSTEGVTSGQSTTGAVDVVVFKMDTNGNTIWIRQNRTFNTTDNDVIPNIAVDGDGYSYVAYYTAGIASGHSSLGNYDIVVFKLDTNGNTIWTVQNATFNTDNYDAKPMIECDIYSNLYITYYTHGIASGQSNTGNYDIVVFKLDGNGNTLWVHQNHTFNTTSDDNNPCITVDRDGSSYIAYFTTGAVSGQSNTGSGDIAVLKLDTNGNTKWVFQNQIFNTTSYDYMPMITIDSNYNIYVTYYTNGTTSGQTLTGNPDVVIFKLLGAQPALSLLSYTTQFDLLNKSPVVGDRIKYTYSIKNTGNITITNLDVADTKASSIILGQTTIQPNETISGTGYYTLTQTDIDNRLVTSTAYAFGSFNSQVVNSSSQTITLLIPSLQLIIYQAHYKHPHKTPTNGDKICYQYLVKNTGLITIDNLHVTDSITAVELAQTTIQPSQSIEGWAHYDLTQTDIDQGHLDSIAFVSGISNGNQDVASIQENINLLIEQKSEIKMRYNSGKLKIKNTGNVTLHHLYVNVKSPHIKHHQKILKPHKHFKIRKLGPHVSAEATALTPLQGMVHNVLNVNTF